MNASAKLTAFVLFASAALGTAAWSGCTTGSSTNDDTDGGFRPNVTNDSGTDTDTGTTTPAVCEGNKQDPAKPLRDQTCQNCLNAKCCKELKECFDIAGDPGSGTLGCADYNDCIDNCNETVDGGDPTNCYRDCDDTAAPGVTAAYEALTTTCGEANCKADCE